MRLLSPFIEVSMGYRTTLCMALHLNSAEQTLVELKGTKSFRELEGRFGQEWKFFELQADNERTRIKKEVRFISRVGS